MGPENALDLILSGRHVPAKRGQELGLIDEVTDGDVLDAALALARRKAVEGGPFPKAIERTDKVAGADPAIFAAQRARTARQWPGKTGRSSWRAIACPCV